ncbi:VIT1/CCC1 transporter family protein [Arhodomonas sp. AD133]|uniref:VIT1/CCC1 transporter family protein n=1 Tax=Arhodomonas sp. AD133 TaxID=3415009 RepID=UPI003EB89689
MAIKDRKLRRLYENLQSEVDSAALYHALAAAEDDERLAEVYRRMARLEERHARFWEAEIRRRAGVVSPLRPSWRSRLLAAIAHRFGASWVLPAISGMERAGSRAYERQPESRDSRLPADERYHRRLLSVIRRAGAGLSGDEIARLEGRHGGVDGNALRAAVLGANDGLVSNLSLVMGVAGAAVAGETILLTGLAGLLAGSISMALGEWLSVQSARELHMRQLEVEAQELAEAPEEEAEELALIYEAKGLARSEAQAVAQRLIDDRENALNVLAREELGIDPANLGGSAWVAAGTSFLLFAIGAIIPVVPYFFFGGSQAVLTSLCASAVGLFVIGAAITVLTGRSAWYSGLRQLTFGLGAAMITYGVGWLLGVGLVP